MIYKIGIPEVHINWISVEADNLDLALEKADSMNSDSDTGVDLEEIESLQYSHTLDTDEFKVRLLDGSEVSAEDALDLEGTGERIGE